MDFWQRMAREGEFYWIQNHFKALYNMKIAHKLWVSYISI